jgi:hypothetical protein
MRRVLALLLLSIASLPLHAQCTSNVGPGTAWPQAVVFDPPAPAAGQVVRAFLTPATSSVFPAPTVVRNGTNIDVTGLVDELGILPPPPSPLAVTLGSFPAGQYVVRFRLTGNNSSTCTPLDAPLGIGGASASSVPAAGTTALVAIVASILLLAWFRNRG